MTPTFFPTQKDFRIWLEKNHQSEKELWVGYYKKLTKIQSITWPESVDEALCFGWIDGIRKSIDDKSYKIRFTPRKIKSHWSSVNIERIKILISQKTVSVAGLNAYSKMDPENSKKAAFEQKDVQLSSDYQQEFLKNNLAWEYFSNKAPSYQKQCKWWVMSAKQETTRLKRLHTLIDCSEKEDLIPPMKWSKK